VKSSSSRLFQKLTQKVSRLYLYRLSPFLSNLTVQHSSSFNNLSQTHPTKNTHSTFQQLLRISVLLSQSNTSIIWLINSTQNTISVRNTRLSIATLHHLYEDAYLLDVSIQHLHLAPKLHPCTCPHLLPFQLRNYSLWRLLCPSQANNRAHCLTSTHNSGSHMCTQTRLFMTSSPLVLTAIRITCIFRHFTKNMSQTQIIPRTHPIVMLHELRNRDKMLPGLGFSLNFPSPT
jgi:hypothetical protein